MKKFYKWATIIMAITILIDVAVIIFIVIKGVDTWLIVGNIFIVLCLVTVLSGYCKNYLKCKVKEINDRT